MRLTILFAAVSSVPTLAQAQPSSAALCDAVSNLEQDAAKSNVPQRITLFASEPMEIACSRQTAIPAQVAFCSAAMDAVGIEFKHAFPWKVVECLRDAHLRPITEQVDEYTGMNRQKITHLTAGWPDGVRIDIRYVPTDDFGDQPRFKGYYGRYEMVVWKPSSVSPP